MKKLLLITGALLALTASSALAAGQIHLAVADCGANGTTSVSNTCTSNTGAVTLVGSMVSPQATSQCIGLESIVDAAQGGVLSPWFQVQPGGCRDGKVSTNFDFTAGPFNCNDLFAGAASGGMGIFYPDPSGALIPANSIRFDTFCAVSSLTPLTLDTSTENYIFKLTISKTGTVGGCTGCNTPTSFYLNNVEITQSPGLPLIEATGDGSGQGCGYNGGNISTPTKNTSWGSIKALYR